MIDEIDAKKATDIVRQYCEDNFGNLAFLLFRVHFIKPNTQEGYWIAKCSLIPSMAEKKRVFYQFKLNIKTNKVEEVSEIKEEDL